MKTTKEKADELVEQFRDYVWVDYRHDEEPSYYCMVKCAILSVKHTIDVLNKQREKGFKDWDSFYEQTDLLKELESRC